MTDTSDKMKLRADIMAILNNYSSNVEISSSELKKDIETIKNLDNKEYVSKILFKELASSDQNYVNAVAVIALEAIDNDNFEKAAIETLKEKDLSDDKKFLVISLVRQKGLDIEFEEMRDYMSDPEKMAQDGIEDFLDSTLNDPEAQIDLLDFYQNIPRDEKIYLLNSLSSDFEGDKLANALSLISKLDLEGEEAEILVKNISNLKSKYAIDGLNYILENYNVDTKLKTQISTNLQSLKMKYEDYKNTSIIENSEFFKCYISFVDGLSNFSLVVSRIFKDNSVNCALYTINLNLGVTSCMGFGNIKEDYFATIIKRLFEDSIPVEIKPDVLKSILEFYLDKNKNTNTKIPYENIVWINMLNDCDGIKGSLSEYLNSKLDTINLTDAKVRKMANAKIYESWYFNREQNKLIDEMISNFEDEHPVNIADINNFVEKFIKNRVIPNTDFMNEIISRLLIQAYVARLAGLIVTSSAAYSMCFRNPHLFTFLNAILDKSLYSYLSEIVSQDKDNKFKQEIKTNFSEDEINSIMSSLEAKWV